MAREEQRTQGAAYGPPLLDLKRVSVLVDAAMYLFSALHVEREAEQANKVGVQVKGWML